MKLLFATVLFASLSTAFAQAPAGKADARSAASRPATTKAAPSKAAAARKDAPKVSRRLAAELAQPLEEPDPAIKLSEADLAVAKRVHVGEIPCELGSMVTVKALKRDGFFLVARGVNRYVMHPVESRTGAIRLEDPARGALWLQIGNKSMLMNQKEGKRLADECVSPEQAEFAKNMKAVNLLEPEPAAAKPAAVVPATTGATAAAPAAPLAADPATTNPAAPAAPAAAAPAAAPAPAQ